MHELITPFAGLALLGQDAIHGARRAQVPALVEQRRLDGRRGTVLEAFLVQHGEHLRALGFVQCASWLGPRRGWIRGHRWLLDRPHGRPMAIEGRPRDTQAVASGLGAGLRRKGEHGVHQEFSSGSVWGRFHPHNEPTVF